jgi:UDP-N-acetyl-D-glucosamine dehydrogenase
MINDRMPEYCVERARKILNRNKKALNGAAILILGVAYKRDVADYRESPALKVIDELEKEGAQVSYYDPQVSEYNRHGRTLAGLPDLTAEALAAADLVVITTPHTGVDYHLVQKHANFVFDTKNAMKEVSERSNIELL